VQNGRIRTALAIFASASLIGLLATFASADPNAPDSSNSVSREHDSVNVATEHHYNSPAERANDAMLITEVKSALADDGVADNHVVAVDCDHGKVMLSGVVESAQDAKRAGEVAAAAPGVTGVKNQLTWR
jgi:osmotically-inducible protein OsmY